MHYFYAATSWLSHLLRPWTSELALGFVATLLVVFGNDISRIVTTSIKSLHFTMRVIILVVVCALGYTLLTDWANHLAKDFLTSLPNRWFSVVVIGAFLSAGIIAEKKNYM